VKTDYTHIYRKTKIICTIGPATNSIENLVLLTNAGMDVARLNFSHGTHEDHLGVMKNIQEVRRLTGKQISILQDLGGPKIRTGRLVTQSVELKAGAEITITTQDILGDEKRISTTYDRLSKDVKPGDRILIDDGLIELRVVSTKDTDVLCSIVDGGILKEHKGMNLPGVTVIGPSLTQKDIQDLEFGLQNNVDYVALSFIRSANDIAALKELIQSEGRNVPVVAKIEKGEAIEDIENIIDRSDAIMVARGDLGVELSSEDVPVLQKMLIQRSNSKGKPVITATQMLESMVRDPLPTRAEASDVANAVLDGTDAVMLSAETSVGQFPMDAVKVMDRIIKRAETSGAKYRCAVERSTDEQENIFDAIGHAACVMADQIGASAIVPITHTGASAKTIAKYRPAAKILGVTDNERCIRALNLVWGVRGILISGISDTDTTFQVVKSEILKSGYVKKGETIVLTAGVPLLERGTTNTLKVERL
jgi:pyruvate kinase